MNSGHVQLRAGLLALLACLVISGCAAGARSAAVNPEGANEIRGVEILRYGQRMPLPYSAQKGDRIETDAESTAIVHFANGTVVYVRPNSIVRIGSLFVEIGAIFVKARDLFRVDTEFVAAGAEGTEYAVQVRPRNEVSVVVLEGRVRCISLSGRWPRFLLTAGEMAEFPGWGFVTRSRASGAEIEGIQRWVNEIEGTRSPPR